MKTLRIKAPLVLLALALLAPAGTLLAIDWCHDYTASTVTGSDHQGVGPKDLRRALDKADYDSYNVGNMDPAEVDARLQPGDVVIFGNAHSGVVGPDGKITHYIQQRDDKNQIIAVNPGNVKGQRTFNSNTFEEIKNWRRPVGEGRTIQPYNTNRIRIYRPTKPDSAAVRNRARDAIRSTLRTSAQQTARAGARPPMTTRKPPKARPPKGKP